MWLTSKQPTAARTVRCSSTIPLYCTGMSQPPNPIMRAPKRTWAAWRGVRFRVVPSDWVMDPLSGGASMVERGECARRSVLSPPVRRFSTRTVPHGGAALVESSETQSLARHQRQLRIQAAQGLVLLPRLLAVAQTEVRLDQA